VYERRRRRAWPDPGAAAAVAPTPIPAARQVRIVTLCAAAGILLGAALAAAPPPSGGGCDVIGETDERADVERAHAACRDARTRFGELFGVAAPAAVVVLADEPGYRIGVAAGRALVRWPTGAVLAASVDGDVALQWSDVLPHEIAHALLVVHVYPDGFARHDGYGTPLPDWFEEGVAIWAEPPASRLGRVAQARSLDGARRDLRSIVEGSHPALANREAFAARDGGRLPADAALWAFYPQSAAVLAFVHDAGGSAAVRELARRLAAAVPPYEALLGLPGAADAAALEAAWQRFMRAPDAAAATH
jgi:hypothetical protein